MSETIPFRDGEIDSDVSLDNQATALLFGVDAELIRVHSRRTTVDGATKFPSAWIQQGHRRAREAMAHTGSEAMLASLRYWAQRDHGAGPEVVYEGSACANSRVAV